MSTTIRWLHLTDLHVGMTDQDWLWPGMKRKFFQDLETIYPKAGPWDLVLFTGDLSQKGVEYDRLNEIFGDLWAKFAGLGSTPHLLAVPGNHDLQWRDPEQSTVKVLEEWATRPNVQERFWNNTDCEFRTVVNEAFADYLDWWDNCPYKPDGVNVGQIPGDFSFTFDKNGLKLGIVGLNSAFLQLTKKNDYRGRLALHPRQFMRACPEDDGVKWAHQHHGCILMTHHPAHWLDSGSQDLLHSEILEHMHLHLSGHLHDTNVEQVFSGGTDQAPVCWQGRALFGLEKIRGMELDRQHGYTSGALGIESRQKAWFQFMPRWRAKHGKTWSLVPDQAVKLKVDNDRTKKFDFDLDAAIPLPPPPTGEIFDLYPHCIELALGYAVDSSLTELMAKLKGGLKRGLGVRGAMPVLRDISDIMPALTYQPTRLPDLLACLAPLAVPGAFVRRWREALGLDPEQEPERFRGGVVRIGSKTRKEADAIVRSALFDKPCLWEAGSPVGDRDSHVLDEVPSPGPLKDDRLKSLEKRLLETCRAEDLAGAMETLYEWLYDGAPLVITCCQPYEEFLSTLSPGFYTLPDGIRVNLRELLLLLVQTDEEERIAVDGLITRLNIIFDTYSRMWRTLT